MVCLLPEGHDKYADMELLFSGGKGRELFSSRKSVLLALFLLRAKVLSETREFIPLQTPSLKKPLLSHTKSYPTSCIPHNSAP